MDGSIDAEELSPHCCSKLASVSLGQLDYREGWFAIVPKEEQPGETLCGIQAHLNEAEFPNRNWPAIEHWTEKGLLKPDVWKARTNLSLIVKLEIPISGTAIQIQQQAFQLEQVPDSWPCNLESGWAAHYGRVGGWDSRYLVHKRERGSARIPRILEKDNVLVSVDSFDLEP